MYLQMNDQSYLLSRFGASSLKKVLLMNFTRKLIIKYIISVVFHKLYPRKRAAMP